MSLFSLYDVYEKCDGEIAGIMACDDEAIIWNMGNCANGYISNGEISISIWIETKKKGLFTKAKGEEKVYSYKYDEDDFDGLYDMIMMIDEYYLKHGNLDDYKAK